MWNPIAEELGVTWQSVDAMHWALGKEEMACRAHECISDSQQPGSIEETAETKPESSYDTPATQQFEEYRVHHFNATRPPQMRLPVPLKSQPVEAMAGQANRLRISDMDLVASASMGKDGKANLTVEGKRQAQAAGDKLRARTTISRHKGAMTAVDSHHNRWANYKSSTSAFLPKPSTSMSQAFDGPGLTSEGRRQAQVAGDKLRCRTNPIRHSRPSRVGSLEHGISKNRWSSYSNTRAIRFDERQDAQEGARASSNTTDTEEVPRNEQPSLLEVFEAELCKKISATDSDEAPGVRLPSVLGPAIRVGPSRESSALLGPINEHLQELSAGDIALSQELSAAIDHGIRTAVNGVGACIQGIARGLQEASGVSRQAAGSTRTLDLQLMDNAVLGFQSLTKGITAALEREMPATRPGTASAPHSGPGEVETGSNSTTLGTSHERDPGEDSNTVHKSNKPPLNNDVDPSETAYSSEIHASPQLEIDRQPRSRPTMSKEPRFHRPGPIHLPNRPECIDHLRRSQSTKMLNDQCNIQGPHSSQLDSHFPTLGQFEGEDYEAALSFPALVPQRVPQQSIFGTKARRSGPLNGTHSHIRGQSGGEASQLSQNPIASPGEHFAQRNGHEVLPLGSSAARLAGPFDPLEAEPSARPHLIEGLRRNATIASTDIRHAARRRRPYSDGFDGSGRVAWGAFLKDNGHGPSGLCRASDNRGRPLAANQEHSERLSRREAGSRRSPIAVTGYDDQHHDDSTVGKIDDCVKQLRNLGFGGHDDNGVGRLLIYAQIADGVLMDAIDLIDEEQRAYERLS